MRQEGLVDEPLDGDITDVEYIGNKCYTGAKVLQKFETNKFFEGRCRF